MGLNLWFLNTISVSYCNNFTNKLNLDLYKLRCLFPGFLRYLRKVGWFSTVGLLRPSVHLVSDGSKLCPQLDQFHLQLDVLLFEV